MPQFFPLTISHVQHEPGDALVLTLAVPADLREHFTYIQGQHLTLRAYIDGKETRRAYSLCNAVGEPSLQLAIKKVAGGAFSNWAHQTLQRGTQIDVMQPAGHFNTTLDAKHARHYAGFVAGSGITPLLSIIKTSLQQEPDSRFTLVYCNRTLSSMLFREQLADLKDRFPQRLSLIYLFTAEAQEIELLNGRLSTERCRALLQHWLPSASIDYAFVCGPAAMMQAVAAALSEAGLPDERIKLEYFAAAGSTITPDSAPAQTESLTTLTSAVEMTLIVDGVQRQLRLDKAVDNILDAALEAGIDLPYSCKGGVCATCRCKVLQGEVAMTGNYALSANELAAGYVLSCRSRPLTRRLVLDFD
ncbi:2Fe-2S iron-sulfur cluster-binding protein [Solimicrobium silvestre]|uniref:2Fe-2S iron-sulfur cluster-binding protein n=1 Tax=Solimicrobium silvestre TaxID=2099400 RepID=UPI000CFCDCAC|nr:2Fe-2S iron-sulfur cluster-binding protein [Solimicrobium silvestre]